MAEVKIPAAHREPPNSVESELALLGSIMLRPNALEKVYDIISPGDFYRANHRYIYEVMLELYNRRDAIDVVTVSERLTRQKRLDQVGGVEFLSQLTENVPTSHNITSYATIIADKAILRSLLETAWEIIEEGYTATRDVREIVDEAERKVFEVGQREVKSSLEPIEEIVNNSLKEVLKYFQEGAGYTGVATGFEKFDEITNGLQRGELVIIGARPSMGKSALALNMAENVALRDRTPVAVFTLEMSSNMCGMRMLASIARVDLAKLRKGEADQKDYYDLTKAGSALSEAPIYIDDSGGLTIDEIRAKSRRLKADKGLGLVIVDYIQLLQPRAGIQSREQQIADISRSLKALAKELYVPVVALSQLNRAVENRSADERRPRLSDIRESGAVEQDADLICFIYRHEYYNPDDFESKGRAEVIIAKNRNGPTGACDLTFLKQYTRFENLDEYHTEP